MRTHPLWPTALIALLLISAAWADLPPPVSSHPQNGPAPSARDYNLRNSPVVDVVKRIKDSVVNIHSERSVRAPASEELFSLTPSQSRVNGMGTGIVIDPRGYLVTNQHVVEDVSTLRVRLADGTTLSARVLARDTETDLALLKITPPKPLPVMPLGTTKDLKVGETVVAIGNAYGYDHTVTVGVVSAIGRDVALNKEVRYRSLIQTDASINPGNSGGPLVNMDGELVGVNVAIRAGAQGIGFAIPVDTMITVGGQMLAQVRAKQQVAALGVSARDDVVEQASSRRVILDRVEPGLASKAGLLRGDVVVKVGDVKVRSSLDVQRGLLEYEAGQSVGVVVERDGEKKNVTLALEAAPRNDSRPAASLASLGTPAQTQVFRSLGVRLTPLANVAEVTRSHPQLHGGMTISEVKPDSPAAKAGLKAGDLLVGLHSWEMLTMDNVVFVLNHPERATFSPVKFYILRAGQVHRGYVQLAD